MIATAIYERRFDKARRLIEEGKHDIHEEGMMRWTPIYGACHRAQLELARLLLEKGADANDGTLSNLATPLVASTVNDDRRMCFLLIKHGADVNPYTEQPLDEACMHHRLSIVCLLLEYGAKPIDHTMCDRALEMLKNKTQLRHLLPRELVAIAYEFLV